MGRLIFNVAEYKDPYNFEVVVRIDPVKLVRSRYDGEQHRFDFPPNFVVDEVNWGDGQVNSDMSHTFNTLGEFTVKAKIREIKRGILDLHGNNIIKIVKIPGVFSEPSVGPNITYFDFSLNKIPSGDTLPLLNDILSKNPSDVDRLDAMVNRSFYINLNGQVGHSAKSAPTGKSFGYRLNNGNNLTEDVLLATRRTQAELDKGWELINKGWRVSMSVDDAYRIEMPKSVEDYLVDGHYGDEMDGVRAVTALPFFNSDTNELVGRIMKVLPQQYGVYPRDERSSTADGYQVHRVTLVPQYIYLTWEFQKPGETTWSQDFVVDPLPVPNGGDSFTKIPSHFEGKYKLTKPIVLDRSKYPSGTKVRARLHGRWGNMTTVPQDGGPNDVYGGTIMSRLRTVNSGLDDNLNLILTLP